MNKDIRLSINFYDHPKTIKSERRLGWQGIKSLHTLWIWAALNRPDGHLGINECSMTFKQVLDDEDIEIAAKWTGESGLFVKTLVELRWLDKNKNGYSIHDWQEHNSWAAEDTDRSDKGRFFKLAQICPSKYLELKEKGIDRISSLDYANIVKRMPNNIFSEPQTDPKPTQRDDPKPIAPINN